MRFLFLMAVVVVLTTACDSNRVYEYNQDFKDRTWKTSDTAVFDFRINDTGKKYAIYYNIRNAIDYPFARLFINYSLCDSVGNVLSKKMVMQDLFDQKTGKPNGSSGLGDIYDHQFLILSGYEFKRTGRYFLKLDQFMRLDTLPGVLAVGVRVETEEKE